MILEGFKFSINFLKDNYIKIISLLSLPLILELALSIVLSFYIIEEESLAAILTFLRLILQTWAQCIVILFLVKTESSMSNSDIYIYTFYKLPLIILWSLLIGIVVTLGFLLLIIPGIYIYVRYAFYIFELLLSPKKSLEALRDAFSMTQGMVVEIFTYFLPLVIVIILLAIFIFSITDLLIVELLFSYTLITISFSYTYYFYNQIKRGINGL
tara:strand:- start:714 stop:1352 length:639 start_codon:yes stop_codon:yes gene_type:complete